MRIGFVAEIAGIGGLQNWVLGLGEAMSMRGHEVCFVLPAHVDGSSETAVTSRRIPVRPWPGRLLGGVDIAHSFDGRSSTILRDLDRDVALVHTSFGASAAMFVALGGLRHPAWYLDLVRRRSDLRDEAAGCRAADRVIASSEKVRRELRRYYRVPGSRIEVIHGGHWGRETPLDKGALRRNLGLPEDRFLVLFVGQRHAYKAFDAMFRCFQRVRRSRPGITLVTAPPQGLDGEGVVGVELPWDRMHELYRACDLLVSTSKHEGYSLAYHEAMACGLAVVLPHTAGIVDLCRSYENAVVLHRWRSFETRLVSAMVELIDDDRLRQRLGREARATVRERTWTWVAARTEEVYRSLLRIRGERS